MGWGREHFLYHPMKTTKKNGFSVEKPVGLRRKQRPRCF